MDRLNKIIKIIIDEYSKTCGEREKCEGCKYYNGDCNLDYLIEMLFKWDKEIKKEKSITLKNVDTSMSFLELRNKLIEDREKFDDTIADFMLSYICEEKNTDEYEKHAIESLWDMMQTGLEMINKAGITADEVMEEYQKYLEKIKK